MNNSRVKHLSFIFSLLLHVILIRYGQHIQYNTPQNKETTPKRTPINIKKLRIAGENTNNPHFAKKLTDGDIDAKKRQKRKTKKKKKKKRVSVKKLKNVRKANKSFRQSESRILSESMSANRNFQALKNKGLTMDFVPPKGVKEDELNSLEKKFYSFQKRTFENYLNSFVRAYYDAISKRPYLKDLKLDSLQKLKARVVFDKNGNIISINIFRSSKYESVHEVFEETLKGIYRLPNPPKELIDENNEMTIFYQLNLK